MPKSKSPASGKVKVKVPDYGVIDPTGKLWPYHHLYQARLCADMGVDWKIVRLTGTVNANKVLRENDSSSGLLEMKSMPEMDAERMTMRGFANRTMAEDMILAESQRLKQIVHDEDVKKARREALKEMDEAWKKDLENADVSHGWQSDEEKAASAALENLRSEYAQDK